MPNHVETIVEFRSKVCIYKWGKAGVVNVATPQKGEDDREGKHFSACPFLAFFGKSQLCFNVATTHSKRHAVLFPVSLAYTYLFCVKLK